MAPTRAPPTRAARAWRAPCPRARADRSAPARASPRSTRWGRGLGEAQIIGARPVRPVTDHEVRIVAPPGAAVVARQGLAHVVALVVEIEAQDRAAHADVGG